jgi:hypothetical protein
MIRATAPWRLGALVAPLFALFSVDRTVFAQFDGEAPNSRLTHYPTSYTCTSEGLEMGFEWAASDRETKRFIAIVPPKAEIKPQILEADMEPAAGPVTDGATQPLQEDKAWLDQTGITRIFSSQPVGYFRHYRVVELRVIPLFQGKLHEMRLRKLRWVYRWQPAYRAPEPFRDEAIVRKDQGFGSILPRLIINPEALGMYADPNPPDGENVPATGPLTLARLAAGKRPLLRFDVDRNGLYRIDLGQSPPTDGPAPSLEHLQLYEEGKPVPLYLHKDPARPKDPPELVFYGVASSSKYTRLNRYWLAEDRERPPVRIPEAPVEKAWQSLKPETAFNEALTIEQDNELVIHADNFLTISEFQWAWGELPPADMPTSAIASSQAEGKAWFRETTFDLPGLADPEGQTKFDAHFYFGNNARLDNAVTIEVRINNAAPQMLTLHDADDIVRSFPISNGVLRETSNTLSVKFAQNQGPLGRKDSVYFDNLIAHYRRRFEMPEHGFTFAGDTWSTTTAWRHYAVKGKVPARPLVLEVANALKPKILAHQIDADGVLHFGQKEGGQALYRVLSLDAISTPTAIETAAVADVTKQDTPVDYLIIAHPMFLDLLDPLVAVLREQDKWRVRVVDVNDIYATFDWGLEGPIAIKQYLAWTMRHWPGGGPSYVLLVGDCTSDYRNDFRNKVRNFVPTYTYERGAHAEKWASEHWYTTVCGSDDYPDLLLGRLSVNSRQDAKTLIDKIVRYRRHPTVGPWRSRVTYVADNGEFDEHSEIVRRQARHFALSAQPIYLDALPWEDNFYLPPEAVEEMIQEDGFCKVSPVTTTRILNAFNAGTAFLAYRGHGSPNIWADERIWFGGDSPNSDIQLMRNQDHLPFVVNMTCNSGAIDYPEPPWNLCISEDFMRSPTGGVIAMFVPSGPGVPPSHLRLSEELAHVMFTENVRAMGDIAYLTEYRYLLKNYPIEMIKMFLYLGDPACRIQLPERTERLTVSRSVLTARTRESVRVSGKADLGPGQKGVLGLYSPKDERRFEMPLAFGADGTFAQGLALNPIDEAGTWTLRTYIWNEATGHDLAGWAQLTVVHPGVALTDLRVEPAAGTLKAGEATTLVCVVANPTPLRINSPTLRVYRWLGNERSVVFERRLSFGPRERQIIRVPFKSAEGAYRLEAEIVDSPRTLQEAAPSTRFRQMTGAAVGAKRESRIDLVPRSLSIQLMRAGPQYTRQTELAIGSIGGEPAEDVAVELKYSGADVETQKVGKIASGELRTVRFLKPVPRPDLPRNYAVALSWRAPGTSTTLRAERKGALTGGWPDLVIARDRIRFIDEANAQMFGNPTPTDGHTIYIEVPVKNIGSAPAAQSFSVEAFEGNPTGGKPLTDNAESITRRDIAFLDPGATKSVRFRWDTHNQAGLKALYFRLDGDQRVTESNELNNDTTQTVRVLTKGHLRTGKIFVNVPTAEEKKQQIRPLVATLYNDGETTMRAVIVEIFLGRNQEPEHKIGEVLLDEVPARSERLAVLRWKTTAELRTRVLETIRAQGNENAFSFFARQKGSSRRVTNLAPEVASR